MNELSDKTQTVTQDKAGSVLANRRILVTGATSGLGEAIALQLAIDHGATVIATGRRADRLEHLAARIESGNGCVETHVLDLTDKLAVELFCKSLTEMNSQKGKETGKETRKEKGIDDLVLNAGVTNVGLFTESSFDVDQSIVDTNITANLQLIRRLVEPLSKSKRSNGKTGARILLVASLGGLVPLPYQSVYAGSKAFLVNFGLSLREELKSDGICVMVFAPGGIATEMTDVKAMDKLRSQLADVSSVAKDAVDMFINRRSLVIPGWQNKVTSALARLLPKSTLASIAAKIYRP